MARVQNVEAAVGEDDALASRTGLSDRILELRSAQSPPVHPMTPSQRKGKLRPRDRGRSRLGNHQPACHVCHLGTADRIPAEAGGDG